jgi:glycosyltransferase involved in cell wall biosynthesis
LVQVLDSIASQEFQDYEVVVADSSGRELASFVNRWPKVRFLTLRAGTGLLQARRTAFSESRGDYSIVLDSTRILLPGALAFISSKVDEHDMWFLTEGSIGTGYWSRAAALDKAIITREFDRSNSSVGQQGVLLPRLFKSEVLRKSFSHLWDELPSALLSRITYGDHHLIWIASRRVSTDCGLIRNPTIAHFEDSTLLEVLRKYHRYGESCRDLRELRRFPEVQEFQSHWRTIGTARFREIAQIVPLYAVRMSAFFLGSWGI